MNEIIVLVMKTQGTSRLSGFYRKTLEERLEIIGRRLGDRAVEAVKRGLPLDVADNMVENTVGILGLPLGVATNFVIDGVEVLVPMAIEEPSVIAAASNAARMVRGAGGFVTDVDPPHTVAQIELLDPRPDAPARIAEAEAELLEVADASQPELLSLGGGARLVETREDVGRDRIVIHLVVDCLDAMGANIVNTMAEAVSTKLAELSGARVGLRILTNFADRRRARARCAIPLEALARRGFSGEQVARGVAAACEFAKADPYRAVTHNKGIFNGVDALLVATGNDWRAVEAGGHAWAARNGTYGPLTQWRVEGGRLMGSIEMPMAVGIVGGASRAHPVARFSLELLGAETGGDLAKVAVCAGLASNLAALAALAGEGIQRGHMRLHARKT